jgi:hypothetical protein
MFQMTDNCISHPIFLFKFFLAFKKIFIEGRLVTIHSVFRYLYHLFSYLSYFFIKAPLAFKQLAKRNITSGVFLLGLRPKLFKNNGL